MGLGEYFDKTAEEWIEVRIQSKWPMIAGIQPPLTYERLKKEKLVRAATPPVNWDPFMGLQFNHAPPSALNSTASDCFPSGRRWPRTASRLRLPRR